MDHCFGPLEGVLGGTGGDLDTEATASWLGRGRGQDLTGFLKGTPSDLQTSHETPPLKDSWYLLVGGSSLSNTWTFVGH